METADERDHIHLAGQQMILAKNNGYSSIVVKKLLIASDTSRVLCSSIALL